MAFHQNLQENAPEFDFVEDVSLNKNKKSVSSSEISSGFCECNICLESAQDPVVTLCGHLYCWPCIYKWLHVQTSSIESNKQPKCPICKSRISNSSLIPLYGRGNYPSSEPAPEPEPKSGSPYQPDLVIPSRPSAPSGSILHPAQQIQPMLNHPQPFGNHALGPANLAAPTTPTISSPFVGMVGEMVGAMIFRSPDSSFFAAYPYGPYQNPYPVHGDRGPRVRRQVMQVEKSLNRLTIFFFCCFILCLLLF